MRLPFVKNIWGVMVAGLLCVRGADALISANKLCKSFPVQSPSPALLLAVRSLFRSFLLVHYRDRSPQRGKSAVIQACWNRETHQATGLLQTRIQSHTAQKQRVSLSTNLTFNTIRTIR
jgi:hypothetical protein